LCELNIMQQIVECVPNISEGRDEEKIQRIIASVSDIDGCKVLGVEPDSDYNRTVITIAGIPKSVVEAAKRLVTKACEEIDMQVHNGEHPRLGAVDVCPFIPLAGVTMEDCVSYANEVAKFVGEELGVPSFLYGYSAKNEARNLLSTLRKGEYEGLEARLTPDGDTQHGSKTRYPDYGPSIWNEKCAKSGGITCGARDILVAYNVNTEESDAIVAKKIGSLVRSSGRLLKNSNGDKTRIPGMLTKVQGMGVTLESHGISQVSMNLRDVKMTPLHIAFEAVKTIASDHGVTVNSSELVGLVPLDAMLEAGKWYSPGETDENVLVDSAITQLGLSRLSEFDPNTRIIEWALR